MDLSISLSAWLTGLCLAGAVLGAAAWWRPDSRTLGLLAERLGLACAVLSLVTWIVRWRAAGHLPLFGTYESALSLTVAVLVAAVVAWALGHRGGGLWPVACAVSAALLLHGLTYDTAVYALTISERSWVVDIHAFVAWAAFGALTANAALALWTLIGRSEAAGLRTRWLPFTLSFGFFLHTAMLATGSFYKFLLFGTAWSFDPIETLGFVAWVAYGTLLHMHLFAGWEGRRLAVWCLSLFVLLVVSYRGIVYFPAWSTYHIFDIDLRMHLTGSTPPGQIP